MKLSFIALGLLATAFPAALSAQNDSTPVAQSTSATSRSARVESDVYFLSGTGPFGTWLSPWDDQADMLFFRLSDYFGEKEYKKGAGMKAAKPSGTLYRYSLGYDFKIARIPGSFTVETSYRKGTLKDDSGEHSAFSQLTDNSEGTPTSISISGAYSRSVNSDVNDLSLLTFWRPAGKLGDYVAVGLEYSHGEYACDFNVFYSMTITLKGQSGPLNATNANLHNDTKIEDFLLHVRLGGKPFGVFAQGKCGFIARADLAAGYSARDDYLTITSISTLGQTSDDFIHREKGHLADTMIFKGSASLSGYYKDGANTLELGAGFACESDLGPDRSGETKGLMARLAYTRAW